jgi:hypothetical protein
MGFAFLLANGVVSWSNKRQLTVALSTIEAKYMSTFQATRELCELCG